jgi:hypothetical protein
VHQLSTDINISVLHAAFSLTGHCNKKTDYNDSSLMEVLTLKNVLQKQSHCFRNTQLDKVDVMVVTTTKTIIAFEYFHVNTNP